MNFSSAFPSVSQVFLVVSVLTSLSYSLLKVCHQRLVREVKHRGVEIVVAVSEDKGAQDSGGKGRVISMTKSLCKKL